MTIEFYTVAGEYGCFSNFSRHPIRYKKEWYGTSEAAYQAMKFEGTKYEKVIRKAKGPMEAARIGRDRSLPLRKDWESAKYNIMKDIIREKVKQHESIKKILLSTGSEKIVEHTERDQFWGWSSAKQNHPDWSD